MPLEEAAATAAPAGGKPERTGFAGLFSGGNALPAILLGVHERHRPVLVYALNTWLPELMNRAGFSTKGSLAFLLVLNGGAVIGALIGSRIADRFGPKPVVASCFLIGAVSIALLTLSLPVGVLLLFVAIVGLGTSGTQTLIYGFVANYFSTKVRGRGGGLVRRVRPAGRRRRPAARVQGWPLTLIFYVLGGLARLAGLVITPLLGGGWWYVR